MGKPDSTFDTIRDGLAIAWQWYDWCAFGTTKDGRIVALAADLKKVRPTPKKTFE